MDDSDGGSTEAERLQQGWCATHLDPSLWRRDLLPDQPGYEEAHCKICNKWIGNNKVGGYKSGKSSPSE